MNKDSKSKICPICLVETGNNYFYTCCKCREIYLWDEITDCIADNNYSFSDKGIIFTNDNWDQHWDVVRRRVEEGTETRKVKTSDGVFSIDTQFGVDKKRGTIRIVDSKNVGSYVFLRDIGVIWNFTEPTATPESTTADDNRYPDTCPFCGSPAYQTLTGYDCTGCSGRYE